MFRNFSQFYEFSFGTEVFYLGEIVLVQVIVFGLAGNGDHHGLEHPLALVLDDCSRVTKLTVKVRIEVET